MTPRAKKFLSDILQAITYAEQFSRDTPDYDAYLLDPKTASAVERQLGIIGEAVNQYRREPNTVPLPDTAGMVRFRNLLIHAYDMVQPLIVWRILHEDLPILRAEVSRLLEAVD